MGKGSSRARTGCMLLIALLFVLTLSGGVGYIWATSYDTLVARPDTPAGKLVIHDTNVVDVVSGTLREHVDVQIEGTQVKAIAPTANPPSGVDVIDGAGEFVVPGLIDMHCHTLGSSAAPWTIGLPIAEQNFEELLFAGVTRVFDPGAGVPDVFETREAIASGELLGPTIHAAGPMFTAVGGHPVPMLRSSLPEVLYTTLTEMMTRQVATPDDANRAVAELAPMKPDFIKLVVDAIPDDTPRLEPGLPAAIVKAANAHDLRAVAHIGTTDDAIAAGEAGVSAWIHGVYREEIPTEAIGKLASFGIAMVPTMAVFKSYAELGRERKATALERQMVDPERLATYETVPEDYEPSPGLRRYVEMLREQRAAGLRNVGRLHAAGVRILAGSDQQSGMVPGASLHRELGLLQQAGVPPIEVLRATTLYAARFLAADKDPPYGIVAPGKRADLLIIDANPLEDAANLSAIRAVILGGVRLERYPR